MSLLERISASEALSSLRPAYHAADHMLWAMRGGQGPTPHRVKQRIVREHGRRYGLRVLIETGTYRGDMVQAMRGEFREIHSVELDHELWRRAVNRFAGQRHITLHEGDSGEVLAEILSTLHEPALLLLDGHYSGGVTAGSEHPTPVLSELAHVLAHRVRSHVVLIDDARLFTGEDGYPTLAQMREALRERPDLGIDVGEDVMRITPGS